LQVKFVPHPKPLEKTSLEQPEIKTPKALEIPWTPVIAVFIVAVVIAIVGFVLFRLKKEVSQRNC